LRSAHYWYHMRTNSGMYVKPILVCEWTNIGPQTNLYWSRAWPI